jgi:alpha-galactosidase
MRFFLFVFLFSHALSLNNNVGKTPPLGWNSWNFFGCDVDEEVIKTAAEQLVSTGLKDLGYTYVNIDDCWQGERLPNGTITSDATRFPSGMKALADYVHGLGLKFGLYSDAGPSTCAGRPGSRGYETLDASTYASWGVDFLKYDNCFANVSDFIVDRYQVMGDALLQYAPADRPIYYSTCDWGVYDPWLGWGKNLSNSWRIDDDIVDDWSDLLRMLDNSAGLAKYAGPYGWNDADMLEVGNGGMTNDEYQSHFALWALMKSPLIIGCDLAAMNDSTKFILTSKELIQVNQDPLGVAGDVVWKEGANEAWAAPLADGSRAVVLFNRHSKYSQYKEENITITFETLGYPSGTKATVRDLYQEVDLGTFKDDFTGVVNTHGCQALKITPLELKESYKDWRPWFRTSGNPSSSEGVSKIAFAITVPLCLLLGILIGAVFCRGKDHVVMEVEKKGLLPQSSSVSDPSINRGWREGEGPVLLDCVKGRQGNSETLLRRDDDSI